MDTRYSIKTIKVQLKLGEGIKQTATSPALTGEIARNIYKNLDADQEHFMVLALNTQNEINGFKIIASGSMDQVEVDMKILFRFALLFGATALILVHNHPSGHPDPSDADKILTRSAKSLCDLFGIRLLDHVILGLNKSFSFLEGGLL